MTTLFHVGAVLYAKNVVRMQAFYQHVLGLHVEKAETDHVVLVSLLFQLVIVEIPAAFAASIEIDSPRSSRDETPIKLVLEVASLATTRALASSRDGALLPPDREWDFQGFRVCDGHDPEGNIIQFRQRVAGAEVE